MILKQLRSLREERKLSRPQLAEQTGISETRIYTYETKGREPDLETLIILSDFFHVTIDYLIGHEHDFYAQKKKGELFLDKFGERIRSFRMYRGLSQKQLAEKVGITTTYLAVVENGAKVPKLDTCIKILNALEAPADAVFMDSLVVAIDQKLSYMQTQIEKLHPENRAILMNVFDKLVESYLETQGNKKLPKND